MRLTETVKQLLIINIIMFLGTIMSGNEDLVYSLLALHFPDNNSFGFWQIITHMFMHGGLQHILFNMLALWMFGIQIERMLGSRRFLFFYISCGLGAALIQIIYLYFNFYSNLELLIASGYNSSQIFEMLYQIDVRRISDETVQFIHPEINNLTRLVPDFGKFYYSFFTPMVGASGAIMGILVSFGMFFPESRLMLIFLPVPIKAKYFIPGIILLDLISATTGVSIFSPSNTAYVAHLGGALTGFLIMYYWKKNQFNSNRWN
tara:strand:- start:219 stop:1004 length:786 start_codon:yes stop_codon:yes gene_type:complete